MPNNDTAFRAVAAVAVSRREEVCVAEKDAASSADKMVSAAVLDQATAPTSETHRLRDMAMVVKMKTRKRRLRLLRG